MPKITVLPHEELCPQGVEIDAEPGQSICNVLLEHGIEIEHACEQSCACTTCHVILKKGYDTLESPEEEEEDLLDKAWGLEATSRLSCQAIVKDEDLVIQIPRYTINQVSDTDPESVRFTELYQWVIELPEFDDDPKRCGEKILEAIQSAWIEEAE